MRELLDTNDKSYKYDSSSSAFINTDDEELHRYREKISNLQEKKEIRDRVAALEARILLLEELIREKNNV